MIRETKRASEFASLAECLIPLNLAGACAGAAKAEHIAKLCARSFLHVESGALLEYFDVVILAGAPIAGERPEGWGDLCSVASMGSFRQSDASAKAVIHSTFVYTRPYPHCAVGNLR